MSAERQLVGLLLAQEAWTDAVLAATGAALVGADEDGTISFANGIALELSGHTSDDVIGQPARSLIPAWPERGQDPASGQPIEGWEAWVARADRTTLPIRLSVVRVQRGSEWVDVGAFHPIQALLETEQMLREAEGRFETLVQRAPDGLLVAIKGQIAFANPALAEVLGYDSGEQLVGRPLSDLPEGAVRETVAHSAARALAGETVHDVELPVRHREGEPRYVDAVWVRTEFEGNPAVLGMWRDATSIRQMRFQLTQADRLSNLGLLAAGIAHEINNPLTSVLHNLEFLTTRGHPDPQVVRATSVALDGARRIRRIARGLTTFARVDAEEPHPVLLRDVREDAMRMAEPEIRSRATLRSALGEPTQSVVGNPGALAQVFLNLLAERGAGHRRRGRPGARRDRRVGPPLGLGGPRRRARQRLRHRTQEPPAPVRAALHDEAFGRRLGPRVVDLPADRRRLRRAARGRERGRGRQSIPRGAGQRRPPGTRQPGTPQQR